LSPKKGRDEERLLALLRRMSFDLIDRHKMIVGRPQLLADNSLRICLHYWHLPFLSSDEEKVQLPSSRPHALIQDDFIRALRKKGCNTPADLERNSILKEV
jgi:hypothetical protein